MKKTKFLLAFLLISQFSYNLFAQAGISVSPSRLYFSNSAKGLKAQKITITNPSDKPIEIGVSFADWKYDSTGNNLLFDAGKLPTSCAAALKVLPGSFFTIKPNEQKEISVQFNNAVKRNASASTQTAMVYLTQLNAGQAEKTNGASIKVTVRMGVKVYYSESEDINPNVEIVGFKNATDKNNDNNLLLTIKNSGKIWGDGKVKWEVFSKASGTKFNLDEFDFYTLPNDVRILKAKLPAGIQKGAYTATSIITYGKNKDIKVAELEFVL